MREEELAVFSLGLAGGESATEPECEGFERGDGLAMEEGDACGSPGLDEKRGCQGRINRYATCANCRVAK